MKTYKLSNYIIANEYINSVYILHGYTGVISKIDKDKYELLKGDEMLECELIKLFGSEGFNSLKRCGILTKLTMDEEEKHVTNLGKVLDAKENETFGVTIIVTYYCNFRCPYCFENVISKDMEELRESTITKEIVDDIFRFIDNKKRNGKTLKNLTLFGGEPLLKENYHIVEYIVTKAKKYNVRVDAVTNGYDLDEYFDLCQEGYINKIKLTLDGIGDTHNKRRKHVTDRDSFSRIISNIDYILNNTNALVELRGNINYENLDNMNQLIKYYSKKEYITNPRVFYYFKSLHSCYESEKDKKINDYTLGNMIEEKIKFEHVASYLRGRQVFHPFIENHDIPKFSTEFCKASGELFVIDYNRNVYPCWERVNDSYNLIGTLENGGGFCSNDRYVDWSNRKSYKLTKCRKCPYVFLCCGACPSHTYVKCKNIFSSNCEVNRKVIDESFLKAVQEATYR